MASPARRVRVFLPCSGLGREARGFETFTRECAAALAGRDDVEVTVFGGGAALLATERHVGALSRRGAAAGLLGALLRRVPYVVEQESFALSFLPSLVGGDPDLVYFADLNLGNALWHWRRASGQRYRMLFYNGGATTRPFTRCDLVQQVSPEHLAAALARGESPERQVLLPHGIDVPGTFVRPTDDARRAVRRALGVPADGPLVLSVGALDVSVKRMDYVVREVAALGAPRPHLLLLGADTAETPALRQLAAEALGAGQVTMRSVDRATALAAYGAADVFVLASVREGFGLAYLEALMSGVPCVVHETPTTAYLFGPHGRRADLTRPGVLAGALAELLAGRAGADDRAAEARHAWVRDRFSWTRLAPRYVELFRACAEGRPPILEST
ncbi:MAG: glycosyltransferase family 4 protein [Gemmatimonadetes bacterium]|nr:glycosyltransferase family 4 protein [Gemmatimonadota bacterium]